MATKSKKSSNRKVKVNKLSRSTKTLGKGDMKKVKGGTSTFGHVKIDFKY
jgi:hypothetical protein